MFVISCCRSYCDCFNFFLVMIDLLIVLTDIHYVVDLSSVLGYEPSFDVPIVNVTVVTGQIAVLPCSIDYLGKYKVRCDHAS